MKRFFLTAATAVACVAMAPTAASAAPLINGASNVTATAGVPAGQGTLLASQTFSGTALTFAATFRQAVYQNAGGTLDFYYQVLRTGPGSQSNDEIGSFTVANFASYILDVYASGPDPDGAGFFVAANNTIDGAGNMSGSTTTFGRSPNGGVVTVDFGLNGLAGTENSATYILRTNATAYNNLGTFGILDGSSLQGMTFQPTAAVPEPATWALMLLGFGGIGMTMRRRRQPALAQVA